MVKGRKLRPALTSTDSERIVYFLSKGKRLFGVLHVPTDCTKKIGVIFLNSGPQYRVGPHRMYVKAARRLSQVGFWVLRMDFPGIGDSEGEIDSIHFDCYDPADTCSAIDFLMEKEKIDKVVLIGTCAGARNALMTAARDSRVDSIVLWSLPMITFSLYTPVSKNAPRASMSGIAAKRYLKNWLKKAFSIKAWKDYFFSGRDKISLRTLMSTIWSLAGFRKKSEKNRHKAFFEAFQSVVFSNRPVLFVYGEKDVILKEEFEINFRKFSEGKKQRCDYYIIPDGDHTFTSLKSENTVIVKTVNWLAQNYEFNEEFHGNKVLSS